jgi:hypothetical protein
MKLITDRIAKAVELIESGKVYKHTDNTFRVLTERFAGGYTVTLTSCDCADFESRKATDNTPCKHQWAAIGATAAMLIDSIRKAESITALLTIGKQYADAMATLPQAFVTIARNEYRARHCELSSTKGGNSGNNTPKSTVKAPVTLKASHIDESGMMLIKPQPKSNGTYNGIEI